MKTERRKLTDKLDRICAEIVKIRDKHICQHCGRYAQASNAHCSHVIPKSRGNNLRWEISNLKLLCMHCHLHWWHKDPLEAGKWFEKKFPKRWEYLEMYRHEQSKFTISDLKDLHNDLKIALEHWKGTE